VALREKVPVINFSLGKADWLCEQAHAYGGKVRRAYYKISQDESGCSGLLTFSQKPCLSRLKV
jgi:enoyl-[acyl-carrier protein] reductase II